MASRTLGYGFVTLNGVTRTGKILQEIIERLGHRKDLYLAAKFSESYLSKLVRKPKPLGPVVMTRVCRAFPAYAEALLEAWLSDRADIDYAAACGVRNELGYAFRMMSLAASKEIDTRLVMGLRRSSEAVQRSIAELIVMTNGDEPSLMRRLKLAQSRTADQGAASTPPPGAVPGSEGTRQSGHEARPPL